MDEDDAVKSLIFSKEKELALALMKVADLTGQLEQLRRAGGSADDGKLLRKSRDNRVESVCCLFIDNIFSIFIS